MAARSQRASLLSGDFLRISFRVVSAASIRVRASGSCGSCMNQCAWALAKCNCRISESGDWLTASLKYLTDSPKSSRSYASIASWAGTEDWLEDWAHLPATFPTASRQELRRNTQTRTIYLGLNCIFLMITSLLFEVVLDGFRAIPGSVEGAGVDEPAAFVYGVPAPRSSTETFYDPMKTTVQITSMRPGSGNICAKRPDLYRVMMRTRSGRGFDSRAWHSQKCPRQEVETPNLLAPLRPEDSARSLLQEVSGRLHARHRPSLWFLRAGCGTSTKMDGTRAGPA